MVSDKLLTPLLAVTAPASNGKAALYCKLCNYEFELCLCPDKEHRLQCLARRKDIRLAVLRTLFAENL